MEFGPILRAMKHSKVGALLIALQIAFTMTVLVNAFFMIQGRVAETLRPSGVVEEDLFHLRSTGFGADFDARLTVEEDLAMLRQTPGIVDAVQTNAIPLSGSGWSMGLQTEPGDEIQATGVGVYMVDTHGIDTLGVKLVAGENFTETDVEWRERAQSDWPGKTIVTQAMAQALFPDDPFSAVGKTVYINNDQPMTIVGIIERLQMPWVASTGIERSMLVPVRMLWDSWHYMIRTEPGQREAMMPLIEDQLARSNAQRVIRDMRSMPETRKQGYLMHRGLAIILTVLMVVLTLVTSLGIVGLASFSVNRRTKQIGTRRALGARKRDILRYFLVENFLITTMGVVLGGVMTIGFNMWLVESMSFPKIDWLYIPLGMVVLWIIGQLAVYGPARRACAVPPAVATRTV